MARSMTDRLNAAVAPPPPPSPSVFLGGEVSDLARIMKLPKRDPVDCQRDAITKRFAPATEALVQIMTSRFARAQRLSCACRPRKVSMLDDGTLSITRILPEGYPPEAPMRTTVAEFVADHQTNAWEINTARTVVSLRPGQETLLTAADGEVGYPCIRSLNPTQAWALYEAPQTGGIVGFMGTGSGKSIFFLLVPLVFKDCKLAVLMIEPKQRQHYKSHYLRLREHFTVGSIIFDDSVSGYTVPGTPPLHVISYSKLSNKKSTDFIERLSPDLLSLDEAHRGCGASAINRRIKRYLSGKIKQREDAILAGAVVRSRAVRLFVGSGTLETKSVEDTQMLCAYSLGTGSPLPIDPNEAKAWSAVIDPSYQPDRKSRTAKSLQRAFAGGVIDDNSLETLLDAPEAEIRRGFRERRLQTVGIISANAVSTNVANYFSERKPPTMPDSVKEALKKVREEWKRPDDDDLVEKTEQIACARQVAGGFYLYWSFSKHPCACKPGRAEWEPQCSECLLIADWYRKRKGFNKELRSEILRGQVHLDSRKLCEEAAERYWRNPVYRGDLPKWDAETWPAWAEIENRVQHEERVKWIDDYLAQDAAQWGLENRGIIWFKSTAFGRKIAELSGLSYHAGGPGGEERLRAEKGDKSIICSIKALGAGTDGLQYKYNRQLITEVPASNGGNEGFEQLFARLDREGQPKDEIWTEAYLHVLELREALRKAKAQAEFNREMSGNDQRLLCCDFDFRI